jgi:hypothetical protein
MSDKPRPWPNTAKETRDQAASAAVAGIRALEPILTGTAPMNETERIRREAIALNALQRIARLLEGAGAQTTALT